MEHKIVNGEQVPLSDWDLQYIADKEARHIAQQSEYNLNEYQRLRKEAYDLELGNAFDQIDYACKNGLAALAAKRQEIKDRYPKPL